MLAQRATQLSLRRLAYGGTQASQIVFKRYVTPAAFGAIQKRPLTTERLSPTAGHDILAAQRKLRPTSPHLTIYKPQITWIPSILNRMTGCTLSGLFYIFGAAYLVSPLLGWHLDSASMAAAFGGLPIMIKVAAKFAVALPFTFHGFNGIRHLSWDMAKTFKNVTVARTGWALVGVSLVSAAWLAVFV